MAWSVDASPNDPTAPYNWLSSVVCPAVDRCYAAGAHFDPDAPILAETLIEQWDGTAWSIVPSPNPASVVRQPVRRHLVPDDHQLRRGRHCIPERRGELCARRAVERHELVARSDSDSGRRPDRRALGDHVREQQLHRGRRLRDGGRPVDARGAVLVMRRGAVAAMVIAVVASMVGGGRTRHTGAHARRWSIVPSRESAGADLRQRARSGMSDHDGLLCGWHLRRSLRT